jgi:hypothetical protein
MNTRLQEAIATVRYALTTGQHSAAKDEARHALDVIEAELEEYDRAFIRSANDKWKMPEAPVLARLARAESDYEAAARLRHEHEREEAKQYPFAMARAQVRARSHGLTLEADTYVPANPTTGDRARLVATVPQRATSAATDDEPEGPTVHVRPEEFCYRTRVIKRPGTCLCGDEKYTCKIACTCSGPDPDHAPGCHYHLWRDAPGHVSQVVVEDK